MKAVPLIVARRAWECALDLIGAGDPPAPDFVTDAARRGPDCLTWGDCQALFILHRREPRV
ncbi:hypothetical protein GXW74_19870 [Roseomonas eburnea]|uniref:Uncharacterized protein n=1 Tax=Neoroseomonas eburnea TaxID=1346889 RepID=A0A9X9XGC4_9PROT|nr:hypothetical protein [Neoroseomonas eburnea]MBR0682760.1 hypothetical protein [Neoroseomonas eburnea]